MKKWFDLQVDSKQVNANTGKWHIKIHPLPHEIAGTRSLSSRGSKFGFRSVAETMSGVCQPDQKNKKMLIIYINIACDTVELN